MQVILPVALAAIALASGEQGPTSVEQIANAPPVRLEERQARGTERPEQLTSEAESRGQAAQFANRSSSRQSPQQLAPAGRSAQAPASLSRRSEGRPGSTVRLAGHDRCDADVKKDRPARCRTVIETRAAEFQKAPPPELSPEQRIILEQASRDRLGFDGAARRLAGKGDDRNSMEAQGVASIALKGAQPEPKKPEPVKEPISPEAAALINAIVGQAPQP